MLISHSIISKSLDECFEELISTRGWYKGSPFDRKSASVHKKLFKEGRLSDELKRIYLHNAGYIKSQPELWRWNNDNL